MLEALFLRKSVFHQNCDLFILAHLKTVQGGNEAQTACTEFQILIINREDLEKSNSKKTTTKTKQKEKQIDINKAIQKH